jgi:hypothetical protein
MAPLIEYKTKQQLGEILVSQLATENKHSGGPMSCTPIKVERLSYWLKGFDFSNFNYLTDKFKFEFDIGFRGSVTHHEVTNVLSARSKPEAVEDKIKKELEGNRFVGPFREKPFKLMQLSPLDLAEKKSHGTYRMIQHLSFPEGSSINDGILKNLSCSVCLNSRCN